MLIIRHLDEFLNIRFRTRKSLFPDNISLEKKKSNSIIQYKTHIINELRLLKSFKNNIIVNAPENRKLKFLGKGIQNKKLFRKT